MGRMPGSSRRSPLETISASKLLNWKVESSLSLVSEIFMEGCLPEAEIARFQNIIAVRSWCRQVRRSTGTWCSPVHMDGV